jgi:hypothetical protein
LFINLWIKELFNIGLFINLCSNNCVLQLSTRKVGQSFLEECNLLLCWYGGREIVTTVITIYFCAKCWLLDYSGPGPKRLEGHFVLTTENIWQLQFGTHDCKAKLFSLSFSLGCMYVNSKYLCTSSCLWMGYLCMHRTHGV